MPDQDEHDRPENLVEPAHLPVKPAATLEEAANSHLFSFRFHSQLA